MVRTALVLVSGKISELPSGDTLAGAGGGAVVPTVVSTTTYTIAGTDNGAIIHCTNSSAVTITVPASTITTAFEVAIVQKGTGQITLVGAGGVTIDSYGGALKSQGRHAGMSLYYISSNLFGLVGQITT